MHVVLEERISDTSISATVSRSRMADYLITMAPRTDAEALRILRRAFPYSTLADRVAALAQRA